MSAPRRTCEGALPVFPAPPPHWRLFYPGSQLSVSPPKPPQGTAPVHVFGQAQSLEPPGLPEQVQVDAEDRICDDEGDLKNELLRLFRMLRIESVDLLQHLVEAPHLYGDRLRKMRKLSDDLVFLLHVGRQREARARIEQQMQQQVFRKRKFVETAEVVVPQMEKRIASATHRRISEMPGSSSTPPDLPTTREIQVRVKQASWQGQLEEANKCPGGASGSGTADADASVRQEDDARPCSAFSVAGDPLLAAQSLASASAQAEFFLEDSDHPATRDRPATLETQLADKKVLGVLEGPSVGEPAAAKVIPESSLAAATAHGKCNGAPSSSSGSARSPLTGRTTPSTWMSFSGREKILAVVSGFRNSCVQASAAACDLVNRARNHVRLSPPEQLHQVVSTEGDVQ